MQNNKELKNVCYSGLAPEFINVDTISWILSPLTLLPTGCKGNKRGTSFVSLYSEAKPSVEGGAERRMRGKSAAFTLAEVLITLGIIGVVAAMTMPSLISNYEKKQTVAQLQKVYAELSQAVQLSEVVNGDKKDWDYSKSGVDFFDTYMTQFVKVSTHKVGDSKTDRNITYYQTSGLPEIDLKSLYNTSNILTLSSGSQIFISSEDIAANAKRKWITVDVNGFKKPNKMGRDLFCFNIGHQGVMPCSTDDTDYIDYNEIPRSKLLQGPSTEKYQCSRSARGVWCGALIMKDGWEIKSDYPW